MVKKSEEGPCAHCGEPLRVAQWSLSRNFKSCPECSGLDAKKEHIFQAYPAHFDVTDHRSSSINPDGPQSWCSYHRDRASERGITTRCSGLAAREAREKG
jgi:hypothetical protein